MDNPSSVPPTVVMHCYDNLITLIGDAAATHSNRTWYSMALTHPSAQEVRKKCA